MYRSELGSRLGRIGDQRKFAPKERVSRVDNFYDNGLLFIWVVEGGIKLWDRLAVYRIRSS